MFYAVVSDYYYKFAIDLIASDKISGILNYDKLCDFVIYDIITKRLGHLMRFARHLPICERIMRQVAKVKQTSWNTTKKIVWKCRMTLGMIKREDLDVQIGFQGHP